MMKMIFALLCILGGVLLIFLLPNIYKGIEAIDYHHMIAPRWTSYVAFLFKIWETGFSTEILLGYADGWATQHNIIIDLIYHSGLFGLALFSLIVIRFIHRIKTVGLLKTVKYGTDFKLYLGFVGIALLVDNFLNVNFSLPYYSVSVLLIFVCSIASLENRTGTPCLQR